MSDSLTLLRVTPAFDWRVVDGAPAHEENIGGLAAQVALQTVETATLGIIQEVVTMGLSGLPREATAGDLIRVRATSGASLTGVHRRNLAWLFGVVAALVRRRRDPPDLVHVHASGLFEPLLAVLAARIVLRAPVVLTVHCSAVATYVPQSRRDEIVQVLTRAAERAAVRRAARTLTLTRRVAAKLGAGAEAMPDWVQAKRFGPGPRRAVAAAAFAQTHGVPAGVPVAVFVGRVSREKGWPALVAAAQTMTDLNLQVIVCGDGPDLPDLRARVQALGLEARFTLAGAVSHDDVAGALELGSLLVLPSAHEELGSVLIEAMAAGVPSVAYDVGGTAEAIEPGVTGVLVPAGDERALLAAIRYALTDPELRGSAAARGPQKAQAEYDAASGARRLAELYRELIAGQAPR